MEDAELRLSRSELLSEIEAGQAEMLSELSIATHDGKLERHSQLCEVVSDDDGMLELEGPLPVLELHASLGFSIKAEKEGAEVLIRDEEKWKLVREACPDIISVHCESGKGSLAAIVSFLDEDAVMKALVAFWELRLKGVHRLTPEIGMCSSEMRRRSERELKKVFLAHMFNVSDGLVKERSAHADKLDQEIRNTKVKLKKKFRNLLNFQNLRAILEDLSFQHEQTLLKIGEFQRAIICFTSVITGLAQENEECGANEFMLGPHWTWCQLHYLLERECKRMQAQLPLYGRRSDIVSEIYSNQVTVLVGETGSGKSTQLVQYLADAGYARDGRSIVCTQPRKVAAMALAERVKEECAGCLQSSFPVGCVTSSSSQTLTRPADITFTTDFVLLQLCLSDPFLSKFSCVIVDEAHERSLNTDLLLALLKCCLSKRSNLRVVIMSATADADLMSSYFGVGEVLRVPGRNFPVKVLYESEIPAADGWDTGDKEETGYLSRVIKCVLSLHERDKEGTILAFLPSPPEVDLACRHGFGSSALVLPFYGKLPNEELQRVFQPNPTGKRKIVFATNFAETSLTIPDVKSVVDCGLAKDSIFDPQTGMNVLEVGKIDRSSAIQRAGRAGRTRAGVCYRLYSKAEFEEMPAHRLPEIKRVHLGLAILKLLALGIKEPNNFDFVEAPDLQSILLALRVLEQLGAVKQIFSGEHALTNLGWKLVRLGVEPRMGKILLDSIMQGYGQDGLVIAALMSNSRSVFYRSGSEEMKGRADCLKMRFCHPHGDLFTLLSVYQEWDSLPDRQRNKWCVVNSISAKSLRKCRDHVNEMRTCLKYELNLNVSSKWGWSPRCTAEHSTPLRKIIFSAMAANLAVFSGHDRVGYDVVSVEQQQAYLHPSSAILVYGVKPEFVVFGEILHTSCTFLVLVTVVDPEWIGSLSPSIGYDVGVLAESIMKKWVVTMASSNFLTRVCGKQGRNVMLLRNKIQERHNQRCIIDHSYENNTLAVFTTSAQMRDAKCLVYKCIDRERRRMDNECTEKFLVPNSCNQISSPTLLYGAGGLIRDVLMPGDYASIEVMYESCSRLEEVDDEELLELFDQCGEGISGYDKFPTGPGPERDGQHHKWGVIRFCSRSAAEVAVELLNGATVRKAVLFVRALIGSTVNNFNRSPFPALKATLAWARRRRKNWATVTCSPEDIDHVLISCQCQGICGTSVSVKPDRSRANAMFLIGLDASVNEKILKEALLDLCGCPVLDVYMPRSPAPLWQPSVTEVHQMLTREITPFVHADKFHVSVFEPNDRDYTARAEIRFEDSVHQGGTLALAHLEGFTLPGCQPWQKISHQRVFSAQVHCSRLVFAVINDDLLDLMTALQHQHHGTKIFISSQETRFHRVQINGTSLGVTAGCKSAIEKLMEGQAVVCESLGESAIRLLSTKKGAQLTKSVESQTQTFVMYDKRTRVAKIYGPKAKKAAALEELLSGLAKLHHESKCRQVVLRGEGIPAGLMREIVKLHGPDLQGLKELAGVGVNINVDHRGHLLFVEGGNMDAVMKVQTAVAEVAQLLGSHDKVAAMEDWLAQWSGGAATAENECSICFCPMEDRYCLEGCGHEFCRSCLVDQINSSIRHREGFPLTCAHNGCSQIFLLTDIHTLLTMEQQEDLQSASLSAFVAQSHGRYRFCTTPDCPNVYEISSGAGHSFACAACSVQLCTACHVEYHEDLSCEEYREFKLDPDASLHAWRRGKEKDVKNCPGCSSVIEKIDGCNHMTCKCGKHVCWVCLSTFGDPSTCYDHLRKLHGGIDGEIDLVGVD